MMKQFTLLVVVCSCALIQQAQCQGQQLQCSNFDVEHTGPPESGVSLTFCRNDSLQCCLQDHIDAVTDVARDRLSLGLRLQMRETSLKFNDTIDLIKFYFKTGFTEAFIGSLPTLGIFTFVEFSQIVGPLLEEFTNNIKTYDTTNIIQTIATRLATVAEEFVGDGRNETAACVHKAILDNVNETDEAAVTRGLIVLQRAVDTLDRFADFLYRYRMNTEFTFPRDCVRRFIELNFCARCTRKSPPLCSNTCGALFRGCLSPYYTVLNEQFDLIWNISRQVLRITNDTLQTLFANERDIINEQLAVLQLSNCPGVTFPNPVGKRQAQPNIHAVFIPQARMMELLTLNGRGIAYDNENGRGPLVCRPAENEMQFCTNNTERGQGNYCASKVDCTSMCRCYDGVRDRMDNSEEFTMNGVDGQDDNPAIDLTESELTEIVTEVGMPARAFITESSTAFPDGVTVPPPPAANHAATVAAMSLMVLVLAAIVTLFF